MTRRTLTSTSKIKDNTIKYELAIDDKTDNGGGVDILSLKIEKSEYDFELFDFKNNRIETSYFKNGTKCNKVYSINADACCSNIKGIKLEKINKNKIIFNKLSQIIKQNKLIIPFLQYSKFPIVSIKETINVSGNENDINNKIYLTIDNINNKVDCKYISDIRNIEIINQNNDTKFKLNDKPIDIYQLNQTNKINQLDQADQITENLLLESRCNGDFGLENSLINGKLVLLNAKHQNDDVQIIPMGWSEEIRDKEYNMIAKRLDGINKGLILIPIFSNCHVSTLIIEKKDNKIVKCASFDSSTDHLSEDKSQIKEDVFLPLFEGILPGNRIKNKEIVVLNNEDLQTFIQSKLKYKLSSSLEKQLPDKKNKTIKFGNCGYYTLSFIKHIITNSCEYKSIDEIYKDRNGIKEAVQDKVNKELKYYEDAKVLEKFLENRQKQGNFGNRLQGTMIAEQYPEMAHAIIANKFKCFNGNIE